VHTHKTLNCYKLLFGFLINLSLYDMLKACIAHTRRQCYKSFMQLGKKKCYWKQSNRVYMWVTGITTVTEITDVVTE